MGGGQVCKRGYQWPREGVPWKPTKGYGHHRHCACISSAQVFSVAPRALPRRLYTYLACLFRFPCFPFSFPYTSHYFDYVSLNIFIFGLSRLARAYEYRDRHFQLSQVDGLLLLVSRFWLFVCVSRCNPYRPARENVCVSPCYLDIFLRWVIYMWNDT